MPKQLDTVATNDRFEYYAYRGDGNCWQIYRKLEGKESEVWFAVVSELKPDGIVQSLNSTTKVDSKVYVEPLAYINDRFYKELLKGLARLIKEGHIPYAEIEYEPPEDEGIAFDLTAPATV